MGDNHSSFLNDKNVSLNPKMKGYSMVAGRGILYHIGVRKNKSQIISK